MLRVHVGAGAGWGLAGAWKWSRWRTRWRRRWVVRKGGDAVAQLFLATAHRKLDRPDEARQAYEQAAQWLEKNQEALAKDKGQAEELRRFWAEAEEVLERKKQ